MARTKQATRQSTARLPPSRLGISKLPSIPKKKKNPPVNEPSKINLLLNCGDQQQQPEQLMIHKLYHDYREDYNCPEIPVEYQVYYYTNVEQHGSNEATEPSLSHLQLEAEHKRKVLPAKTPTTTSTTPQPSSAVAVAGTVKDAPPSKRRSVQGTAPPLNEDDHQGEENITTPTAMTTSPGAHVRERLARTLRRIDQDRHDVQPSGIVHDIIDPSLNCRITGQEEVRKLVWERAHVDERRRGMNLKSVYYYSKESRKHLAVLCHNRYGRPKPFPIGLYYWDPSQMDWVLRSGVHRERHDVEAVLQRLADAGKKEASSDAAISDVDTWECWEPVTLEQFFEDYRLDQQHRANYMKMVTGRGAFQWIPSVVRCSMQQQKNEKDGEDDDDVVLVAPQAHFVGGIAGLPERRFCEQLYRDLECVLSSMLPLFGKIKTLKKIERKHWNDRGPGIPVFLDLMLELEPSVWWCWREDDELVSQHIEKDIFGDPEHCWIRYNNDANAKLEAAYAKQCGVGEFSPMPGFVVNFNSMMQTEVATETMRDVLRVPCGGINSSGTDKVSDQIATPKAERKMETFQSTKTATTTDLQVVVKAQRYLVPPHSTYAGRWHTEGFTENIVAAGVYYLSVTDKTTGGNLDFRPPETPCDGFFEDRLTSEFGAEMENAEDFDQEEPGESKRTGEPWWTHYIKEVDVKTGTAVAFANTNPHRFRSIRNDTDHVQERLFLNFFVVDPNKPLTATTNNTPSLPFLRRVLGRFSDVTAVQDEILSFLLEPGAQNMLHRKVVRDRARSAMARHKTKWLIQEFGNSGSVTFHERPPPSYPDDQDVLPSTYEASGCDSSNLGSGL